MQYLSGSFARVPLYQSRVGGRCNRGCRFRGQCHQLLCFIVYDGDDDVRGTGDCQKQV